MPERVPEKSHRPGGRYRRSRSSRPPDSPGQHSTMERALLEGGQPPKTVVIYTLLSVVLGAIAFIWLISILPFTSEKASSDSGITRVFIWTIVTMLASGWIGGTLYNFRGLIKHASDRDYSPDHSLSYYLRPFAGSISGLVVFFLLLGGALALNIRTDGTSSVPNWHTFAGRMPYIAFALLAGYGSHEFMLKLKDLANNLFALSGAKQSRRR